MPNQLTREVLRKIIKTNRNMYSPYPDLVDILYIPDGMWDSLLEIDEFENLKAIYGNGNFFENLAGLDQCRKLTSIFLANNRLSSMTGLKSLHLIQVLDLSRNCLVEIKGIHHLKKLRSLNLSGNRISDLSPLASNTGMEILDVSSNCICDSGVTLGTLECMHGLRCLYIKDNPCNISRIQLIQQVPSLTYIDDSSVPAAKQPNRFTNENTPSNLPAGCYSSFCPLYTVPTKYSDPKVMR